MKDSKAVNVTNQDIESVLHRECCIYSNKPRRLDRDPSKTYVESRDNATQYNNRTEICTCKRKKRNKCYISSQVYRSQNSYIYSRDIADIGVGHVKVLTKRRVTRLYLPEKVDIGVGPTELKLESGNYNTWRTGYLHQKSTSSKCVGDLMIYTNVNVIDKKISPIPQIKSSATSLKVINEETRKNNSDSYRIVANTSRAKNDVINVETKDIQQQDTIVVFKLNRNSQTKLNKSKSNIELFDLPGYKIPTFEKIVNEKKNISSDSLVQQIYNLENSSVENKSITSFNLMEDKLERQHRNIFTNKLKVKHSDDEEAVSNLKSASLLRRRFETLRECLGRRRDSKKNSVIVKSSSQVSICSRKNVSIVSDPPSLEARSFSNTKMYSPKISDTEAHDQVKSFTNVNTVVSNEVIRNLPSDIVATEYQGVKGMFKLWGKKFYLDEDESDKIIQPNEETTQIINTKRNTTELKKELEKNKKQGKIFSFFKKKTKNKDVDKLNTPFKAGKGVTAGRCEVDDALAIKIGLGKDYNLEHFLPQIKYIKKDYDTVVTSQMDIKNSTHIRWNNKMYATSSSTVFELIDCLYKNNAMLMRSRSDMDTENSSIYFNSRLKENFVKQDIKAFMIPDTILNIQNYKRKSVIINSSRSSKRQNKNVEVKFSNNKRIINKSEEFSQNIEIVLHSNNFVRPNNEISSKYIFINIPEGYFSDTASDNCNNNNNSSDEEIYKIVEYEAPYLIRNLNKAKELKLDTGDHIPICNDIDVTVGITVRKSNESKVLDTIKLKPSLHRDVIIQGSDVLIPKRCDVIGVGIITQKDIRHIKKPILKIQEYLSDEESNSILIPQKKCEFAESFWQDFYRNLTPLGIDLYSSCVSDSQVKGSSEINSLHSFNNQGDGSKSCPNIHDDYKASTIVSSCETSSCSQCRGFSHEEDRKLDDGKLSKYVNKFIRRPCDPQPKNDGKRVLPKDSLEVYKKRKLYAASNKSNWRYEQENDNPSEPYSVPSVEDKCAQNSSGVGPVTIKPCCKRSQPKKRYCQKRVLLQDCNTMNNILSEALSDKCIEGILSFKKSTGCDVCKDMGPKCPMHIQVNPNPICEIPQPPCMDSCKATKHPACNIKNSSSCNVPSPPICPAGPPTPCQDPCPPKPPPCQTAPHCVQKTPYDSPSICPHSSSSCTYRPSRIPTSYSPEYLPCSKSPHNIPISALVPSKSPPCVPKSPPCPKSPPYSSEPDCYTPKSPTCPKSPLCPPKSHIKSPHFHTPPSKHKSSCESSPPCFDPTLPLCGPRSRCPFKTCHPKPNTPRVHAPPLNNRASVCSSPRSQLNSISYGQQNVSTTSGSRPCKCSAHPSPQCPSSLQNSSLLISPTKKCPPSTVGSLNKSSSMTEPKNACTQKQSRTSFAAKLICSCSKDTCPSPPKLNSCTRLPRQVGPKELCPPKKPFCTRQTKSPAISQKTSGMSLTMAPEDCHKCNSLTGALKRVIDKVASNFSGTGRECKTTCPNKPKSKPACLVPPPMKNTCNDPSKLTGLHLKKMPMPTKSDCSDNSSDHDLIRLNSREKLLIKIRQGSSSTDEIRENCNIKVQDEDGKTLYERRDYTKNRPYVVRDMYRDSHVNRVSTANIVNDVMSTQKNKENKIEPNNSNSCSVVEINLTLKLKEKNKTKKLNINHSRINSTSEKCENCPNSCNESPKEVFLVQDQNESKTTDEARDLNIKITIKNYKQSDTPSLNENLTTYSQTDEFSKKISNKFKTVSTGYSEMLLRHQAYSMHTRLNPNPQDNLNSEQIFGPNSLHMMNLENTVVPHLSAISLKYNDNLVPINTKLSKPHISIQSKMSQNADVLSVKKQVVKSFNYAKENFNTHKNTVDEGVLETIGTDNEYSENKKIKPHTKEEKKEKLRNIFEAENKLETKKEKLKQILSDILTSDSSDDTSISNQLADEVTYASLKPNFFRDVDSMNNFCHIEASASEKESIETISDTEDQIYPTEEDNDTSERSKSNDNENIGCLCSHVAAKLNMNKKGGCCCRLKERDNKETHCDLREYNLDCNANFVNVETQYSKFDKLKSITMANISTIVTVEKLLSVQDVTSFSHYKKYHKYGIDSKAPCISDKMSNSNELNHEIIKKNFEPEDILQLNETKKAVLEIYTEQIISARGHNIVARLPRFVGNTERKMCNHEEVLAGYKRFKNGDRLLSIGR